VSKIWISFLILIGIIGGGLSYNNFLIGKTEKMLELADEAYEVCESDSLKCMEKLAEIDNQLESMGVLLCAFLDRDVINDAKDSIISARGLILVGADECRWGIDMMREKIDHIKNSAEVKWKYLL